MPDPLDGAVRVQDDPLAQATPIKLQKSARARAGVTTNKKPRLTSSQAVAQLLAEEGQPPVIGRTVRGRRGVVAQPGTVPYRDLSWIEKIGYNPPKAADLPQVVMDRLMGEGAYQGLQEQKGVPALLAKLGVGMLDPTNVVLMKLPGAAGLLKTPMGRKIVGAAFAGANVPNVVRMAREGDPYGAGALGALSLLPAAVLRGEKPLPKMSSAAERIWQSAEREAAPRKPAEPKLSRAAREQFEREANELLAQATGLRQRIPSMAKQPVKTTGKLPPEVTPEEPAVGARPTRLQPRPSPTRGPLPAPFVSPSPIEHPLGPFEGPPPEPVLGPVRPPAIPGVDPAVRAPIEPEIYPQPETLQDVLDLIEQQNPPPPPAPGPEYPAIYPSITPSIPEDVPIQFDTPQAPGQFRIRSPKELMEEPTDATLQAGRVGSPETEALRPGEPGRDLVRGGAGEVPRGEGEAPPGASAGSVGPQGPDAPDAATEASSAGDVGRPPKKTNRRNRQRGSIDIGIPRPTLPTREEIQAALESHRQTLDAIRNTLVEGQSYIQRTAPETFRRTRELQASPDIVQAELDRIDYALRDLNPDERRAFGALIAEDRNLAKGTHTFDPTPLLQTHPKIAAAVARYKQAVESIYPGYRETGGYGAAQSLGATSGAYMPLFPKEYEQMFGSSLGGKAGRPTMRPIAELQKMPGEKRFEGKLNSTNAVLDPLAANRLRLSKLVPAAKIRDMLSTAREEGLLKELGETERFPEGGLGIRINRQLVPATEFNIAERVGIPEVELEHMGLPKRGVMPTQALAELEPALSNLQHPTHARNSLLNILIRGYLLSPSEVGAHTVTLSSLGRAAQKTAINTGFAPLDNLLSSVGTVRALAGIKDVFNIRGYAKEDRLAAQLLGARAGVFREVPKKLDITQPGQYVLYGPKGVYSNALTGTYKMMKALGASDDEIMDAFRTLPSHISSAQPHAQKVLNALGMGTFYQTGTKALKAGFKYGFPHDIESTKRFLGTATFLTLAGAALDHEHKPWFDQERRLLPGQFVVGKDRTAKNVIGDLRLDRVTRIAMETPARFVQAKQQGATVSEAAERALYSALNQVTRPAVSGPVPNIASTAAGVIPYLVPSNDYRGPKLLPQSTATEGLTDAARERALLGSFLPLSNITMGDVSEEYRKNIPQGEGYTVANRILRALGQLPLRTMKPGQAEQQIRRTRQQRDAAQRRAKARSRG